MQPIIYECKTFTNKPGDMFVVAVDSKIVKIDEIVHKKCHNQEFRVCVTRVLMGHKSVKNELRYEIQG